MNNEEIINCNCPACKQPLKYYKQQLDPRSKLTPKWIGTCETPDCMYVWVTLNDANWTRLQVDEVFAAGYKWMDKGIKARMGEG